MSRSGLYEDDGDDPLAFGRWRAATQSAINGKRGQAMLRELLVALDAMPNKRLAANSLVNAEGEYCTLGALGAKRGIDLESLDPEDYDQVAAAFGVNAKVVQEIVWHNDELNYRWDYATRITPEVGPDVPWSLHQVRLELDEGAERWRKMRDWVAKQIKQEAVAP